MSNLLAQVPLTVSPFVSLPTAPTLPYTYKSLPSTLPPSAVELAVSSTSGPSSTTTDGKPRFIISPSGSASHPEEIIASCRALEKHLKQIKEDADKTLSKWEQDLREREFAEKRRVAPGYLDRDEKILQPEKKGNSTTQDLMTGDTMQEPAIAGGTLKTSDAGAELDRAFGSMPMR